MGFTPRAMSVATVALLCMDPAGAAPGPSAHAAGLVGCFADRGDPHGLDGRDLDGARSQNHPQMTVERCLRFCAVMGYRYAGVQYANSCFCGNQYGRFGNSTECDMPCTGDASQVCGGTWANSVYRLNGELGSPFSD